LTGFEAIAHYNGWVMAALGAAIVFAGLAVLVFVISLLPKVFALFEKGTDKRTVTIVSEASAPAEPLPAPPATASCSDPETLAKLIEPLVVELTPPFQLADLYSRCREHDLPHPHLTLACLQRQGYLVFQGEGSFTWKPDHANAQKG
jgi:hypothetical protein